MVQMMQRKNREQRPKIWHHSTREERMKDESVINVRNCDIYKQIFGSELIQANAREMSSSVYNEAC